MNDFSGFSKQLRRAPVLPVLLGVLLFGGESALAAGQAVSINDSVTNALGYNPRLKMLQTNQQAVGHDIDRAKGGYFPRVDVSFGYGTESYSDEYSRSINKDDDFNERMEATVQLTQLLFDGQETTSRVGIEENKFESAKLRVLDNAEAIALDAVIAHLEVYRQRLLYGLAEKNVKDHEGILGMLADRQKAGAGSIADVTQTEGRLARAKASRAEILSGVKSAEANYLRVIGKTPGDVEYFSPAAALVPKSVDEAVQAASADNPKVRALAFNVKEAESRMDLSKSTFFPKVNLELSSGYLDQVDSSETYEKFNRAMVRLNWNLINGGADVADEKAAAARKFQAMSTQDDQRVQVVEEATATWAKLQAAKEQVVDFNEATVQNQKTLDAYMKQFTVGQRTLLDVLDAHNELYQSSGLLITAKVNEVIASERLLALAGKLIQSLQIDPKTYLAGK